MIALDKLRSFTTYNPDTGEFRWAADKQPAKLQNQLVGCVDQDGYRRVQFDGKTYSAASMIWYYVTGTYPTLQVDHKDRNPGNNKWKNLRLSTNSQNMVNRKQQRDLPKGVYRCKDRYRVYGYANYKSQYLGVFNTIEEATVARKKFDVSQFGEFAV